MDDISLMFIGMAVMVLLFSSFFIALTANQRKKLQHQKDLQHMREQQQNQLIEAAVRSEETERHRIAEVLHDEVGAILSSSKLHLQGIKSNSLVGRDKQLYDKGEELLNDAIQKVRDISHNLHSNILKEFGLNEAIRHFTNKIAKGSLINASTALDDAYITQNPENDISIYRMVQELINNILKHAHANEIRISSVSSDRHLQLTLFHNGNGLTQQQFEAMRYNKDGLGLKNIQNRVILLNGHIQFSRTGEGYQITIDIPLKAPSL